MILTFTTKHQHGFLYTPHLLSARTWIESVSKILQV